MLHQHPVSRGASAEGGTQISYNADDTNLYGMLGHWPAMTTRQDEAGNLGLG